MAVYRRWDKSKPPSGQFVLNTDCPQAVGLVAWYPMGGVAGQTYVPNLVGAERPLTPVNSPSMILGADGRPAFRFAAGSSQRLSYTTAAPVTSLPLTLACWAKPTNNAITSSLLYLDNTVNTTSQIGLDISGTEANDPLRAYSSTTSSKANNPTFNAWSHFAGVFVSSSAWTAYINAVAGTAATGGGSSGSGNTRLDVGAQFRSDFSSGVNFHTGEIGEIQIYNIAVGQEILARLASPATAYELWYPLRSRKWFTQGAGAQSVSITQVTETDTAQALAAVAGAVTAAIAQVASTETAQALAATSGTTTAVAAAQETDTSQALTATTAVSAAITRTDETDTAQALAVASAITTAIARADETDAAQALTAQQPGSFTAVDETDTAQSLSVTTAITAAITQVASTETAQALTVVATKTTAIAQVTETDTAQAFTADLLAALGLALEIDAAQTLSSATAGAQTVAITAAQETDAARPITQGDTDAGYLEIVRLQSRITPYLRLGSQITPHVRLPSRL